MENFIPFLIGIAFYVYKTWANFQKEQDKARKRNPGKRDPLTSKRPSVPASSTPPVTKKKIEPFLLEEIVNPNNPYEPKYKHLYQKENVKEKISREAKVELVRMEHTTFSEMKSQEELSAETKTNRQVHQLHQHGKTQHQEEEVPYTFDIRDAIIKEAILNRPQF